MMKEFYMSKILFLLLCCFFQQVVFAQEKICTHKKISLSFYTIGYLYFNDGYKYSGIDNDVINEIEKRTDCIFSKDLMARARIWNELKMNRLSMTVSGISTPERTEFAYFVPYFKAKNELLIINKYSNIRNIEDIIKNNNIKFSKVRSFKHGYFFDKMFASIPSNRLKNVVNVKDTYNNILDGTTQALVSLNIVIPYWLDILSLKDKISIIDFDLNNEKIPHGLVLSKKYFTKKQAAQFNKVILNMKNDGTLYQIYKKYLGEKIAKDIMI